MTAQKQPLEVGVPLYPFSHTSLFQKDEAGSLAADDFTGAPWPVNSPSEVQVDIVTASGHSSVLSPSNSDWRLRDLSAANSPSGLDSDVHSVRSTYMG